MSESTDVSVVHYVWFGADATDEMRKYLNDGAVKIRVYPNPDGRKWRISAIDAKGQEMGWENDSHLCPIDCS